MDYKFDVFKTQPLNLEEKSSLYKVSFEDSLSFFEMDEKNEDNTHFKELVSGKKITF